MRYPRLRLHGAWDLRHTLAVAFRVLVRSPGAAADPAGGTRSPSTPARLAPRRRDRPPAPDMERMESVPLSQLHLPPNANPRRGGNVHPSQLGRGSKRAGSGVTPKIDKAAPTKGFRVSIVTLFEHAHTWDRCRGLRSHSDPPFSLWRSWTRHWRPMPGGHRLPEAIARRRHSGARNSTIEPSANKNRHFGSTASASRNCRSTNITVFFLP